MTPSDLGGDAERGPVRFTRSAEQVALSGHILSVSSALVGVCLTGIYLVRVIEGLRSVVTFADNLLAFDAIAFVLAAVLSYGALRSSRAIAYRKLERAADACFLVGLALMALLCVLVAYEVF